MPSLRASSAAMLVIAGCTTRAPTPDSRGQDAPPNVDEASQARAPAEVPSPTAELAWAELADAALARAARPGAVVVIDLQSGEIVATAERPGQVPHPASTPRSPGSTVKPFMVLAALHEQVVDPDETIECAGPREYGGESLTCFHDHGALALAPALMTSCNHYSFAIGSRLGLARVGDHFHAFGFGGKGGGQVPFSGNIEALAPAVAVGHGGLSVSPERLAQAYAALASGRAPPTSWHEWAYTEAELDIVRAAMVDVVADPRGTGGRAAVEGLSVAGKTGTTEVGEGDEQLGLALFAGWAPAEDPRVVVVVQLEGEGTGGESAAPVAAEVFAALLEDRQ